MITIMITYTHILTVRMAPELRERLNEHKLATGSNSLNATVNALLVFALDSADAMSARAARDELSVTAHPPRP